MTITLEYLTTIINSDKIRSFTQGQLEETLVLLCNNHATGAFKAGQHERLMETVKALLVVRNSQELSRKVSLNSRVAIIISAIALSVSIYQAASTQSRGATQATQVSTPPAKGESAPQHPTTPAPPPLPQDKSQNK